MSKLPSITGSDGGPTYCLLHGEMKDDRCVPCSAWGVKSNGPTVTFDGEPCTISEVTPTSIAFLRPAVGRLKPPQRVDDPQKYWTEPPPSRSPRLVYWLERIHHGWRPNRRLQGMGYHTATDWYGVYVWEYLNVLSPALQATGA